MANVIATLSSVSYRCCILGDFKLPEVNWDCGVYTNSYDYTKICGTIFDSGLHQLVNLPTRERNILDLVLVHDPLLVSDLHTRAPIGFSDHYIVCFNLFVGYTDLESN